MLSGGIAGGFHGDVLNANPTDEEGKKRLVEEIKSRAKGSITSKNYPEAVQLYGKAIELFPQDAIIHANRSMCYLSMNNADSALSDAKEATKLDPTYAKGFYRLGMAQLKLNDRSAAKQSFLQGIALVPDDKDFRLQLDKLQAAGVQSAPTVAVSAAAVSTAGAPKEKKAPATANPPTEPDAASDEKEESIGLVRGYKKTSDGRVTTFFNNEMDETTKSLIGNIAPKKIDVAAAVAVSAAPSANGVSVWNSAGTFEEVIHTPWAISKLREKMTALAFSSVDAVNALPLDSVIVVSSVEITGDASVTANRGKRKHIFDFTIKVDWKLTVMEHAISPEIITGSISMHDVTADRDYEFGSVTIDSSCSPSKDANKIINSHIKADEKGLKLAMVQACNAFCDEFLRK